MYISILICIYNCVSISCYITYWCNFESETQFWKCSGIRFGFGCREPIRVDTLLDVSENLQRNIDQGSVTAPQDRCDVIMLIKQYIGSENLAQRPLLVLTAGRSNLVDLVPTEKHPSCRKGGMNCPGWPWNHRNWRHVDCVATWWWTEAWQQPLQDLLRPMQCFGSCCEVWVWWGVSGMCWLFGGFVQKSFLYRSQVT